MNYLARVKEQHHDIYHICVKETNAEFTARISGKLKYQMKNQEEYPVVGDWVEVDRNTNENGEGKIVAVLPRKNAMQRVEAGRSGNVQVIAANIDLIFICMSLNENFNPRRLERYLAAAYGCKIKPVVILTKADLCGEAEEYRRQILRENPDLEVIVTSSLKQDTIALVRKKITPDMTVSFIGSSGVGKSTLINGLMGEETMETGEIREDDARGRHTTTHRELLELPGGGYVIDTPGMREFQLDESSVSDVFEEIEELACRCRFSDCTHTNEPGCQILMALEEGTLDRKRYQSYLKLKKEETRRRKNVKIKKK